MKKQNFIRTITSGIFWETIYALVIIEAGLLISMLLEHLQ